MDPQFIIKPTFRGNENSDSRYLEIPARTANALARAEYLDFITPYQRAFNIYEWMRINRLGKFVVTYPQSNMLLLQKHNGCGWNPQGFMRFASDEITADRAKINVEDCYDEVFGSAFEKWLEWGRSPQVDLRAEYTNLLTQTIMQQSALGVQATLTAGGLFPEDITFEDAVPTNVRNAFMRSAFVSKGWIQAAREQAAMNDARAQMDNDLIASGDISTNGEEFTGDVLDLFDRRMTASTRKMRRAMVMGGKPAFGGRQSRPVWLVSPSIAEQVYKQKRVQDAALATNEVRITTERIGSPGSASGDGILVYFIDGVPVIPIYEVEMFSEFVKGTAHFDYLTLTGVIQLGGSFADIPSAAGDVAIRVQQSERNEDLGKTTYLSHMLLAGAFTDSDYISGGYKFTQPA